jgi:hypothetical protein
MAKHILTTAMNTLLQDLSQGIQTFFNSLFSHESILARYLAKSYQETRT